VSIGYGAILSYYKPQSNSIDLARDTQDLVEQLQQQNNGLQQSGKGQTTKVDGITAMLTQLSNSSPFNGQREVDWLLTVPRQEGLFYTIFISPESQWSTMKPVFNQMIDSLQFAR
jgi:hypothetical protein